MTKGAHKKLGNCLAHVGPGGIRCRCCTPIHGTVKENRKHVNRVFRRKAKLDISIENF